MTFRGNCIIDKWVLVSIRGLIVMMSDVQGLELFNGGKTNLKHGFNVVQLNRPQFKPTKVGNNARVSDFVGNTDTQR